MVVVCAIAIVIRIKVVGKKSSVGSPYIDLLMCFLTFGLCLTIFAFTFITDPGEQYGLVSVGLLLLVTVLMCLWFIPKVRFAVFSYVALVVDQNCVYTLSGSCYFDRKKGGHSKCE